MLRLSLSLFLFIASATVSFADDYVMIYSPYVPNSTRVLGSLRGANFNSTADQAIQIVGSSKYAITQILVTNCSASLTLAVGGFYTAAAKGGSAIVSSLQVYTALTGATSLLAATLAITNTAWTANPLYLSLTTAQGATATCDIYIVGTDLT